MNWLRGDTPNYIRSEDGRFHIAKAMVFGLPVYTLVDGQERVCTERGDGALDRCKQAAEERAK